MICIHAKIPAKEQPDSVIRVSEYLPCIRFELPQKSRIGEVLQSFYDELAKYESKTDPKGKTSQSRDTDAKKNSSLEKELSELKKNNSELEDQINLLTRQLVREQNSLSRASRALDSQQLLPENTQLVRVGEELLL